MHRDNSRRFRFAAAPFRRFLGASGLLVLISALVAVAPATDPAAPAPLTIELDDVPSKLSLPAEVGNNYFITAVVRGAVPAKVWLARSEDAPFGVTIPPFGDGHYQLNLADDRVVLALRRTGGDGQCYVFARTTGGQVIQSAAIRFQVPDPVASFYVYEGQSANNSPFRWFRADKATAVGLKVDPSYPGMKVRGECGGRTWEFATKDDTEFLLAVTPEIAALWDRNVEFHFRSDPPLYANEVTFRAIPTRLALPSDGFSLSARANSDVVIPGTRGYLSFHVGALCKDDPNGRPDGADVALRRDDDPNGGGGDPPVGEARVFHVGDQQFAWFVSAVDGHPGGDVVATLRVVQGKPAEKQLMLTAIAQIGQGNNSCCGQCMTFNGKTYNAAEARVQLEELYRRSGADDLAGFLAAVAAREKELGSNVQIVNSGTSVPLPEWLVATMQKLGWTP